MADLVKGASAKTELNAKAILTQYLTAKATLEAITSETVVDLASAKQAILTMKVIETVMLDAIFYLMKQQSRG